MTVSTTSGGSPLISSWDRWRPEGNKCFPQKPLMTMHYIICPWLKISCVEHSKSLMVLHWRCCLPHTRILVLLSLWEHFQTSCFFQLPGPAPTPILQAPHTYRWATHCKSMIKSMDVKSWLASPVNSEIIRTHARAHVHSHILTHTHSNAVTN